MNFTKGEILYIDKPHGWTSFDAVKRLRSTLLRRLKIKKLKVGHAGTLDPLATGVMLVCTGKATKLIDTLQAHVKEYVATIALGATTPSFDLETEIDATYPTAHITRELVEETLKRFTGAIEQVPPAFSACKVDGQRAYKMARRGEGGSDTSQIACNRRNRAHGVFSREHHCKGSVQQGYVYPRFGPRYRNRLRQWRPSYGPAPHQSRRCVGIRLSDSAAGSRTAEYRCHRIG